MEDFNDNNRGKKDKKHQVIAVAVITPSGTFPNDDEYRRTDGDEIVAHILKKAAAHLHLTNTTDWSAYVEDRLIDIKRTFAENDLHGIVEIEWHKTEGGGGA